MHGTILLSIFVITGLVCILLITQMNKIQNREVRVGLKYTLLFSGIWSFTEATKFIFVNPEIAQFTQSISLSVGLITVVTWMYFASAFSGKKYHKNNQIAMLTIITVLGIIILKLTNPIHGLYFTIESAEYVSVSYGWIHNVITFFAYSISLYGVYLVYQGLKKIGGNWLDTLIIMVTLLIPSVTSLVIRTDFLLPSLSGVSLDPIAVSLFVIVTIFAITSSYGSFYNDSRSRFIENMGIPTIIINQNGECVNYNSEVDELDEDIDDSRSITEIVSDESTLDKMSSGDIIEVGDSYFSANLVKFNDSYDNGTVAVLLFDNTENIVKERRIEIQNTKFQQLADGITHEVRNGIQIIHGHSEVVKSENLTERQKESMDIIMDGLDRLDRVSNDLNALAVSGDQSLEMKYADFNEITDIKENNTSLSFDVLGEGKIYTNTMRYDLMLSKFVEFAEKMGGKEVNIERNGDQLILSSDCEPIQEDLIDQAFEYGEAVPNAEVGSILPVISAVSTSHGWELEVEEGFDGLKIVINGVSKPQI